MKTLIEPIIDEWERKNDFKHYSKEYLQIYKKFHQGDLKEHNYKISTHWYWMIRGFPSIVEKDSHFEIKKD